MAHSTGATWWLWNFGDSTTSSLENPTHVFNNMGPYHISLTIGNDSCQFTYDFTNTNIGVGEGGLGTPLIPSMPLLHRWDVHLWLSISTTRFINTISWSWDFGDGDTSALSDPVHGIPRPARMM